MELIIYTFYLFNLFRVVHTEIRVFGVTVAYGRDGLTVSPQRIRNDMQLSHIIYLGETRVSATAFFSFLRGINLVYKLKKYDLFRENCRHFSRLLIRELQPSHPEQGNSFADFQFET